jgi:hypothetical protein
MVERKTELRRQRSRRKKMLKLKARLARAKTNSERDQIVKKIQRISPWWTAPKTAAAK